MRPGQNKRMRGRNNNRKGPNPLTRAYESNGPDVKIRGTAHHVAEKYLQLARDAQSSGDPVMAESYLQHAEHYFRIIAAAQQAQQQAQLGYMRQPGDPEPEDVEDDDDGGIPDRFASPIERVQPTFNPQQPPYPAPNQQPQQGTPYSERPQYNNNDRNDRPQQDRSYQDRGPRPDRPFQDRNQNNRNGQNNRGPRDQRPQRDQRDQRDFRNDQQQPRFEPRPDPKPPVMVEDDVAPALPSFITAPVRIVQPEAAPPEPQVNEVAAPPDSEAAEAGRFHLRNRRRKRPAAAGSEESGEGAPAPQGGEMPVAE